ncbi:hypothetical protein EYC87_05305 [Halieaceae bacterium IMCC8485]|uniref:Uncharacterized protein n=1 Tax=Candidatus Seongchinamella marina TaxID=2518990 RepID=A0ABT3SSN0_9GAMM|nr:hypothetical protein [Candidatus Seongchinamella marina]MCX2973001.1 hypothetical protein [Candidatus Seongchinamella marina]
MSRSIGDTARGFSVPAARHGTSRLPNDTTPKQKLMADLLRQDARDDATGSWIRSASRQVSGRKKR